MREKLKTKKASSYTVPTYWNLLYDPGGFRGAPRGYTQYTHLGLDSRSPRVHRPRWDGRYAALAVRAAKSGAGRAGDKPTAISTHVISNLSLAMHAVRQTPPT